MTTVSERMGECPARIPSGCRIIDIKIGWANVLEMGTCDACWRVGGPMGSASSDVRSKYIQATVAGIKAKGLESFSVGVGKAVMARHATEAERPAIAEQVAEAERRAKIGPIFRRWGMTWRGIRPWYEWPHRCAWAGLMAAWREFRRLWKGGCGCRRAKV